MLPNGSKLLLGGAVLATVAAIVYGITQEGSLGTVGLIFAAAAIAFLAGIVIYIREADVSAMDTAALTESAAAAPPPGDSIWPMVSAVGGVLVVVGLVTYPPVFIFGLIALLAAAVDWMVQAYSERASSDAGFNAVVRGRIAHPLEFPILAAVGVAVLVYSFSRIMLFLSKTTGPAVFGVVAALVLAVGFVIAFVPTIRSGLISGVAVIATVGLVAGGAAAALDGEREMHEHETTSALAEEGECDTPDETEADEHASQTVANKANIAAEVTLHGDDTLTVRNLDVDVDDTAVMVIRASTTNVRFINESEEHRRLELDLGTRPETDETGDTVPDTEVPSQLCTQLVEEGGSQLLTFSILTPSRYAATPYRFVVPGVDGAEVPVEVS
jgi:hypothetical protein